MMGPIRLQRQPEKALVTSIAGLLGECRRLSESGPFRRRRSREWFANAAKIIGEMMEEGNRLLANGMRLTQTVACTSKLPKSGTHSLKDSGHDSSSSPTSWNSCVRSPPRCRSPCGSTTARSVTIAKRISGTAPACRFEGNRW